MVEDCVFQSITATFLNFFQDSEIPEVASFFQGMIANMSWNGITLANYCESLERLYT